MILNWALPLLFRTSDSPASATFHNRTLSFDALEGSSKLVGVLQRKKWKLTIRCVDCLETLRHKIPLLSFEDNEEPLDVEACLENQIVGHPICLLYRFDGRRRSGYRLQTSRPIIPLVLMLCYNRWLVVLRHTMAVFCHP